MAYIDEPIHLDKKPGRSYLDALSMVALACVLLVALLMLWTFSLSKIDGGLAVLYKVGFAFAAVMCAASLFAFRKSAFSHPENAFLVIVLSLTCFSSWAYDTNEVSEDLESHFGFVLDYSDFGNTHQYTEAEAAIVLRYLDSESTGMDIDEYVRIQESGEGSINFANIYIWTDTHALQLKDDALNAYDRVYDDDVKAESPSINKLYNRVSSLPSSLLFFILTMLSVPFTLKFILCKLVYAFIYSFVLYFGMKKLRSGKMIYAVVALYPTSIFITSNYNYDFWVIVWMMYAVATMIGQLQRPHEKFSVPDQVKLLLAFFFGLAPKAIYFPLVFLCLLIKRDKFSTSRNCIVFRAATVACALLVLASFALPFLSTPDSRSDMRGGSDVNASAQLAFILADPLRYASIDAGFLFGFFTSADTVNFINDFAYIKRGSTVIWMLVCALTVFVTVTDTRFNDRCVANWKTRTLVVVLIVITLVLSTTALYVSFTPVGCDTVHGFKARYVLPLVYPLLAFMGSRKLYWPRTDRATSVYNTVILAMMGFFVLFSLWETYISLLT